MGKFSLWPIKGIMSAALVIGILFVIPFTNCSQNPQNAVTPVTAFLDPSKKVASIKAEFTGRTPLSFCQSEEAYSCMKKIYSAEVPNGKALPTQECTYISDEMKLCPQTQTFLFNSSAAQENCNGCQETYEYMEYSCHLRIANKQGVYPITFTEPTMQASLRKLYDVCISLVEDAP